MQRKGKTVPYTPITGHMFSFLTNEGKLAVRFAHGGRRNLPGKVQYGVMRSVRQGDEGICYSAGYFAAGYTSVKIKF